MGLPKTVLGPNSPQVARIVGNLRRAVEGVSAASSTVATEELVAATPVDTRHCQSNWLITTGSPTTEVVGSRKAVSFAGLIVGYARALHYRITDGALWTSNNVFYLESLKDGSSPQQPSPGWIDKTLDKAMHKIAERVQGFFR